MHLRDFKVYVYEQSRAYTIHDKNGFTQIQKKGFFVIITSSSNAPP